jgi:phosphate/sulfate permease
MHTYYILIVGFLFLLAVSLLIVGVSNDAVNFLNSAIGSKAASFSTILAIAAVGVFVGAVFSNGMMEVARKGIFNPEYFAFNEIMIVFLAVMLTNILLIDFFNSLGLPTSTTISIVFGLLGAAVAVSIYKISRSTDEFEKVGSYINIVNSGIIIVGIFLSIVIAFTIGMIVQWFVRLAFSFNLNNTYKYWSGLWGGFAITAILYFLLIKGAKGSTIITPEMLDIINLHTMKILLISFVGWTVLFQVLVLFTRVNILKITVLAGTFALAMAFAGNDLVNFIGVPLAGFESFKAFVASGAVDDTRFLMTALQEPVNTPVYFLIAAGLIMILTLRFSKKAKSVTATTIDLSRQSEGSERFTSTALARFIVRLSVDVSNGLSRIIPPAFNKFIENRFETEQESNTQEKTAFDLVRASVNLVVASILIAIGTSFKLPLSTTYVTFMVAMGTSLSDGAWGRDSAVYRITGVLTVVGGWFFTAFGAFLTAFLLATAIYFGKLPIIILLSVLVVYILIRSQAFHKKRISSDKLNQSETTMSFEVMQSCDDEVQMTVQNVGNILIMVYTDFSKEKYKELKKLKKESKNLSKEINKIRDDIPSTLKKFEEKDLESGHYYVQVVTYMKEMCNSLLHIVEPAFNHVDNKHSSDKEQLNKLKEYNDQLRDFFSFVSDMLTKKNYKQLENLITRRNSIIDITNDILLNRVKILRKNKKGVKISMTYIEMLTETRSLILNLVQLVKSEVKLYDSVNAKNDLEGPEV